MRSIEPSNVITVLNLFFCLCCSSRSFLVLTESNKNLEKPKKQKIADPNSPACTYMGSRSFLVFDQKYQKPRDKPQRKLQTELHPDSNNDTKIAAPSHMSVQHTPPPTPIMHHQQHPRRHPPQHPLQHLPATSAIQHCHQTPSPTPSQFRD